MKKVLILGGDGFCGWPTALHLSNKGFSVGIVDNLSRRKIDVDLGLESLTPISTIERRIECWFDLTGKKIDFFNIDISLEYCKFKEVLNLFRPDVIIHFAEQRSAPFSMKTLDTKRYTVSNNVNATFNVLLGIQESKHPIHLVHLGTMGVYGYSQHGIEIPEGYLKANTVDQHGTTIEFEALYPTQPGSVYHMTKSLDQIMFQFLNKNDGVLITDLHQGIVWGTQTPECNASPYLINRFDYDGDFGTVLNRFLVQAATKNPLTVHGSGGQTRAFININDTVKCIELAILNPPTFGDRVKIINQVTETHTVKDLANIVSKISGAEIAYVDNPRKEAAENSLSVNNATFLNLGLNPIYLSDKIMEEIMEVAAKHAERCDVSRIPCTSRW